ncbi:MAG: EamA family transporter [Boseongicola sp.]|nr:MAG: EamA family transporter [Boseongicola sp.]
MEPPLANMRAIILMTTAMAFFAFSDAFIKEVTLTISVPQCMALISIGNLLIFAPQVWMHGERIFSRNVFNTAVIARTIGEVLGSIGVVMSLATIPLATASALFQAQPLAVTLAAALVLKETVGWRRWSAVAIGFGGVMVILRPGVGEVDPNLLWSILAIIGLTMRDIGSRVLPAGLSSPFALTWAVIALLVVTTAMVVFGDGWTPMDTKSIFLVLGATITVTIAFIAVTLAMRTGEVSAIAPFRYTRMIFALTIAYFVFAEVPDVFTWVGTFIIIGSGIYAFWRERHLQLARQNP